MATQSYFYKSVVVQLMTGLLVLSSLLLAGCSGSNESKSAEGGGAGTAQAAEARPVEVSVGEAGVRQVPSYLQATGSFIADESSDVAPQTSGQVVQTPVDAGAFVGQGAVIARLNDRDARLRLQQAQSAEQQAVSAVRQAEARLGLGVNGRFDASAVPEVRAAQAALESSEAAARLAETNAKRYAVLIESGDVARSVYDQARTQAETARAAVNSARQQLEAAQNNARTSNVGIASAQSGLESARSQVALARKAVDDTVIRAPFSGYVSDRPVAVGEYVTPASRIATVLRTNPIKLLLQVPEAEAGRIAGGMNVSASIAAYADRQFNGRVTAVNPAVDPTARSLSVEVSIENSQNQLRPGMFATARIVQPGGVQGVFVPRRAVLTNANTNSSSVYVIEGDTARLRVVQIGEAEDDEIRIVQGVNGGETVATSNLDQLFDGVKVQRR